MDGAIEVDAIEVGAIEVDAIEVEDEGKTGDRGSDAAAGLLSATTKASLRFFVRRFRCGVTFGASEVIGRARIQCIAIVYALQSSSAAVARSIASSSSD